jgi:hypothetical protein
MRRETPAISALTTLMLLRNLLPGADKGTSELNVLPSICNMRLLWGGPRSFAAINDVDLFNPSFLFASLLWGSIGVGYFIYGKKQQSLPAMVGGILMIVVSYFVGSALLMSLISILLIVAVYVLLKRGY